MSDELDEVFVAEREKVNAELIGIGEPMIDEWAKLSFGMRLLLINLYYQGKRAGVEAMANG